MGRTAWPTDAVASVGCEHSECHDVQSSQVRVCGESRCRVDARADCSDENVVVVGKASERPSLHRVRLPVERVAVLSREHTQVQATQLTRGHTQTHAEARVSQSPVALHSSSGLLACLLERACAHGWPCGVRSAVRCGAVRCSAVRRRTCCQLSFVTSPKRSGSSERRDEEAEADEVAVTALALLVGAEPDDASVLGTADDCCTSTALMTAACRCVHRVSAASRLLRRDDNRPDEWDGRRDEWSSRGECREWQQAASEQTGGGGGKAEQKSKLCTQAGA